MPLTEEMKKWNQKVEEEMNKTLDIKYIGEFSEEIQALYTKLKGAILDLYPNIKIVPKGNYISFKAKTNFLDIQLQRKLLKCIINVKNRKLKDSKKISRNVSKFGHFGSGDYEFLITSSEDIEKVLDLIKQSYMINS